MTHGGERPRASGKAAVRVMPMSNGMAQGICALADSLGLHGVRIDLAGRHDKAGLMASTAEALHFPGWFGHNWDAWFDCLVDLRWRPASGYVLVFEHADELRRTSPETLDTAISILEEVAQVWSNRSVPLRVFLGLSEPT